MLDTPRLRARDLAKRGEAQGGRGRCAFGHTIRHVSSRHLKINNQKKQKTESFLLTVFQIGDEEEVVEEAEAVGFFLFEEVHEAI